jgi:hypothetical protein
MTHYEPSDTVRGMLGRPELTAEEIDAAAGKCGWPNQDPHPFLVAEKVAQ